MRRSHKRLLAFLVVLPLFVVGLACLYMLGMDQFEGSERGFGESLEWVTETMTSTGYGRDAKWNHPVMIGFVITVQFTGVFMILMVFPVFVVPFIEERFEGRLARVLPPLNDAIVIYCYGAPVATLVDEILRAKIPIVILEEDEATARRLRDRGLNVVHANLEDEDPNLAALKNARAIVANGGDNANAVLTLSARESGFEGPLLVLVENPARRSPMMRAGATATFTPSHVLAAAIAAKASSKISPRVSGAHSLGRHIEIAELRVHATSSLAGKTLADADLRRKTGATIIGQWVGGTLQEQPSASATVRPGTILVALGTQESIVRLGEIARPIREDGPLIVVGKDEVASKVTEFLRDCGEEVLTVAGPSTDDDASSLTGDPLDQDLLRRAGVIGARAVVISLSSDSATIFASAVIRDLAPETPIIASVRRAENVGRMHRAGADFALSVSQVAEQVLARPILGEDNVELESHLKIVKAQAGELEGASPIGGRVRERTGCSIVAIERGDEVIVDFGGEFAIATDDEIYVCGAAEAVTRFFEHYPSCRITSRDA